MTGDPSENAMTRIDILNETTNGDEPRFRAVSGELQSFGKTAGEALDAITNQISDERSATLVVVQSHRPDEFFTAEQRDRLGELMALWRDARDRGEMLSQPQQSELNDLIERELKASARRSQAALAKLSG